jgi:DNA-directed RNA polymerase specialized sigma24 family protein
MTVREAAPDRLMEWSEGAELDWDAVYADQLPRIYNFFRFRLGREADAEELTARTFEKKMRSARADTCVRSGSSRWRQSNTAGSGPNRSPSTS